MAKKKPAPTMSMDEIDLAIEATRLLHERVQHGVVTGRTKAANPARNTKPKSGKSKTTKVAEKPEGRKVFVYAKDLRVGDVIEIHGSRPIGNSGAWEDVTVTGSIHSITFDTTYSKTLVTLVDPAWPEIMSEHRLQDYSYILLASGYGKV